MTQHTLISFLSKSKLDPQTGYRRTTYDFGDNRQGTFSFVGIGLVEILKPQKLILIGTSGSMWDVFFDHHQTENEDLVELIDAVANDSVSIELLQRFEAEIGKTSAAPCNA